MSATETANAQAVPHPNNGNATKAMPFIRDSLYEFALAFASEPVELKIRVSIVNSEVVVIVHCHPSDSGRMMGKGNSRITLMRKMAGAIANRFQVKLKQVSIPAKPIMGFARLERVLDTVVVDVPSGRKRVIRAS